MLQISGLVLQLAKYLPKQLYDELTEMPMTHFSIKGSKNINIEQICCKCAAGIRACSAASKISAKTNYMMR